MGFRCIINVFDKVFSLAMRVVREVLLEYNYFEGIFKFQETFCFLPTRSPLIFYYVNVIIT